MTTRRTISRRTAFSTLGGAVAAVSLGPGPGRAAGPVLTRMIGTTGTRVPAVGMGTWITFNVGDDPALRAQRAQVLRTFFDLGGAVVDSSPMYGSSEAVLGYCLERLPDAGRLFAATKVWTWRTGNGPAQMEQSRTLWGIDRFDAMQIHNLLNWEGHLETLLAERGAGRVRHIGITTYDGNDHGTFERLMRERPIDVVQLTYNIVDRDAEHRLLPIAAERGLGVIVNRPFRQKELFRRFAHHPLPAWAAEIGCANWAQFFLKFIVSHPAITCAIPATTRVDHMRENMGALHGPMPDEAMRERMARYIGDL